MSGSRPRHLTYIAVAGLILVFAQTALLAEEESGTSEDGKEVTEQVTEEIIVYAHRPGNKIDIDAIHEELLRSSLIKEFERIRVLKKQNKWRSSEFDDENSSRIKWGYDPREELRMRRSTKLTDLPIDDTKPATLFRFEF
jgi:hypothetical protein